MNYTDSLGMYHDKPTDGGNTSNNGWIYTAYAKALGLPVYDFPLFEAYKKCLVEQYPLLITRRPGDFEPPMSRDEIIGMVSLGYMDPHTLNMNYYQFHTFKKSKPLPWYKLNYIKIFKALKYLNGKHRNTIWQEGIFEAYPLAFRLGAADVYYVRKKTGQECSIYQWLMFWLYAFTIVRFDDDTRTDWSEKNILWLQMKDLGLEKNWWFKMLKKDHKANFIKYFGKDHVFNQEK